MLSYLTENKSETHECTEKKTKEEREEGEVKKTETSKEEQQEKGEETSMPVETVLVQIKERWREQCVINNNLKLLLADEVQRFKVH